MEITAQTGVVRQQGITPHTAGHIGAGLPHQELGAAPEVPGVRPPAPNRTDAKKPCKSRSAASCQFLTIKPDLRLHLPKPGPHLPEPSPLLLLPERLERCIGTQPPREAPASPAASASQGVESVLAAREGGEEGWVRGDADRVWGAEGGDPV